jgi:hypothetical protein
MPVNMKKLGKLAQTLLAVVGACALLVLLGSVGLRAMASHSPDSLNEVISPDGRYRLVSTEDFVGFPGQVCVKDVYVIKAGASLDRSDDSNHIFAGACGGLLGIRWGSNGIEGTLCVVNAVDGVAAVTIRPYAADGKVRVTWSSI